MNATNKVNSSPSLGHPIMNKLGGSARATQMTEDHLPRKKDENWHHQKSGTKYAVESSMKLFAQGADPS